MILFQMPCVAGLRTPPSQPIAIVLPKLPTPLTDGFMGHRDAALEQQFFWHCQDRATGRPRGFGFVTMPDSSAARAAIEELNGANLGGRSLTVNEAREQEQRGGPRRDRW